MPENSVVWSMGSFPNEKKVIGVSHGWVKFLDGTSIIVPIIVSSGTPEKIEGEIVKAIRETMACQTLKEAEY